jgi:hypothetical protein
MALAVIGVLAAGCTESSVCIGKCPDISDSYAVQVQTTSGVCDFTPWLVPPTITVTQTPQGDRVSIPIIDPVNQLTVTLLADVRIPTNGGSVAIFEGLQEAARQSVLGSGVLLDLEADFSGRVYVSNGRRFLDFTLLTWPVTDGGCTVSQFLTAQGSVVK